MIIYTPARRTGEPGSSVCGAVAWIPVRNTCLSGCRTAVASPAPTHLTDKLKKGSSGFPFYAD